ncbi:MAG: UDP-2,3-diacylglucosamine diphosphatase LpxI [Planctomycetota bacterium]
MRRESGIVPSSNEASSNREPLGLIAGWGRFPVLVAQALIDQGHEIHCVGISGHADPVLKTLCHSYKSAGFARPGSHIRFFRRHGIERATMAGKIFKTKLFEKLTWIKNIPDLTFLGQFYPVLLSRNNDRRDDTLLGMVTEMFARRGITFVPATDYAPELLVKEGTLTKINPTAVQLKDIEFGWTMAKHMGGLDVGQSVVVKSGTVLAVEAIEGTDECIRRAGSLCKAGGFTVVKVAKPDQDMRFDVPTIGTGTIETIHKAGGRVLAIEADRTILLDSDETIAAADRLGIAIVATSMAAAVTAAA